MIRLFILILFAWIPFATAAQKPGKASCAASEKEIYSVMKTVIRGKGLDRGYGLHVKSIQHCTIHGSDSAFLQELLVKPQKMDTVGYYPSGQPITLSSSHSYPENNLLLQSDIDELLCSKAHAVGQIWNNSRLGFNANNHHYSYGFSIPYFNAAHNVAVVMYESFCPGLCGTGETLVLKKAAGRWHIHVADSWVH